MKSSGRIPRVWPWTLLAAAWISSGFPARSGEPESAPVPTTEKPEPPVRPKPDAEPVQDPTQPSKRMRRILAPEAAAAPEAARPAPPKLPAMVLKGLVVAANGQGIAMLEIHGLGSLLVKPNSQLVVPTDGRSLTIQIGRISGEGVEMRIPELDQALVIR